MIRTKPSDDLSVKLKRLFSLDLRSLALFRMALAGLILYDLFDRSIRLTQYYTDSGVLPRGPYIEYFASAFRPSIHLMSGAASVQIFLFAVAAFFALMLLVGFRTRIACGASWIMLMSLQERNPMVLQAGDILFAMLLFFAFFLPLGLRFSVDSFLEQRQKGPDFPSLPSDCFSAATVGLLLQICFVYWFTVALKLSDESRHIWFIEGSAVYYTLSIDQLLRPLGYLLASMPMLFLKWLNYFVLVVEVIGPFLLFCPIFPAFSRLMGILIFFALHFGFGIALNLGLFPLVSVVATVPFLPSVFWDQFNSMNLNNLKIISWLRIFFRNGFHFKKCTNGVVFQKTYFDVSAAQGSFSYVGLTRSINLVLIFFTVYIFLWNLGTVYPDMRIQGPMNRIGMALGFEQTWDMFAPPLKDDGWYVIPGKLRNGKEIDLFQGGQAISWVKPHRVALMYPTFRDRKYMMNLWLEENKAHRLYYGQYLCREWNSKHEDAEKLESFKINFMLERTPPDRMPPSVEKKEIWEHWCFSNSEPEVA